MVGYSGGSLYPMFYVAEFDYNTSRTFVNVETAMHSFRMKQCVSVTFNRCLYYKTLALSSLRYWILR